MHHPIHAHGPRLPHQERRLHGLRIQQARGALGETAVDERGLLDGYGAVDHKTMNLTGPCPSAAAYQLRKPTNFPPPLSLPRRPSPSESESPGRPLMAPCTSWSSSSLRRQRKQLHPLAGEGRCPLGERDTGCLDPGCCHCLRLHCSDRGGGGIAPSTGGPGRDAQLQQGGYTEAGTVALPSRDSTRAR